LVRRNLSILNTHKITKSIFDIVNVKTLVFISVQNKHFESGSIQ